MMRITIPLTTWNQHNSAIRGWLDGHDPDWSWVWTGGLGFPAVNINIQEPSTALLFKLTWGGQQCHDIG